MDTLLEVQQGNFGYTKEHLILRDVSFCLGKGEIMTILGQNGIGKTTLLKCIIGLLKWQKGFTLFNGQAFASMEERDGIGYVPQAQKSVFAYTVWEMVALGRARHVGLFGTPSRQDAGRVEKALKIVGILPLKDRLCTQLSGGQYQLVYIARSLVNEPQLLIMDEPESHLDFKNQYRILNLIEQLKHEQGISCIINTHYPDHALKVSDKTLMIGEDGYIQGNTESVITQKNIQEYFDVNTRIIELPEFQNKTRAFVVVD